MFVDGSVTGESDLDGLLRALDAVLEMVESCGFVCCKIPASSGDGGRALLW